MKRLGLTHLLLCAMLGAWILFPTHALAGTTGGLTGQIVDIKTHAPLAGVSVTAASPSQLEHTQTDAAGNFRFLSLSPDTYTLTFSKQGYATMTEPGATVFADQVQTLNISMNVALTTIAKVASSSAGLIKAGTTSDVYSVNQTAAQAAASLVGPGGLSNAYGAIASIPGVSVDAGEQGWFQQVHIRGGDIDQVGYELDGIPVNRVYDNAPQTMLSSLGQQELQVYTGGTPASADAQGIAGYVNQVIKTGTYPGFGVTNTSIGGPAFFHRFSLEAGGSTPTRLFSYYIGLSGANQGYRYMDNTNGASNPNTFFYPVNTYVGGSDVYVGGNVPNLFAPGNTFGIASTSQRDSVVNFHFAIPHKHSGLRDDIQLLYLTSEVIAQYYSSFNDLGAGPATGILGSPYLTWNDGPVYNGPQFTAITSQSQISPYFFPSSAPHPYLTGILPTNQRDTNDNGVAITKLQYQHAISENAYVRAYGYMMYSNWFIYGPNSAQQAFGAELADYEIPDHTFGGNISFADQLSDRHLFSASVSYTGANLQRYSNSFLHSNPNVATLVNPTTQNCYDQTTGLQTLCYSGNAQLGAGTISTSGVPAIPGAASAAGAQWIATSSGIIAALNNVSSRFSALSVTDEWRPNEHFVANVGIRAENFKYLLGNTGANDPSRSFWFAQYNQDYCFGPGDTSPQLGTIGVGGTTICPNAGEQTLQALGPSAMLSNVSGGTISTTRFEPRTSFSYTLNPLTVIRGSFGVYARPQNTSWVQYNTVQEDLPTFLGSHFYSYGFRTPTHNIRPDTSYNYDISLEKRLKGTDITFKLTPFYRSTKDQLQNFFIDPLTGLEAGLNVGRQISTGIELAIQKGNFSHDGLSGQLSFTYTRSRIKYNNFDNSTSNVIDNLNTFIKQYNSYTYTCSLNENTPQCGNGLYAANGSPSFNNGGLTIANPYYCPTVSSSCTYSAQPLMDRNAYYSTYDVVPGPFSGANGYETPIVASLILNYKHKRMTITPSFTFSSGAKYGSPMVWPGYLPQGCTGTLAGGTLNQANAATCSSPTGLPLFIPDAYTGQFDSIGAFKQPWRFQASLAMSYEVSQRVTASLSLTNLVDRCGQRGYAWDQTNVCVYGALPSGIFAPEGNFYPNANGAAPPQMRYPYAFLLNNNNTGFVGTNLPFQATFNVQIKL